MRRSLSLLFASLLVSAGLVSACAGPGAHASGADAQAKATAPVRACFHASRVRNFTTPRHDTLYVRSMEDRVFELTSLGACPDLDGAIQLGVNPDAAAAISLCPGDFARVTLGQAAAPQVCRMRVNRVLSEAEVEALPRRDRP